MDKPFLEDCLARGMSLPEIGKLADKAPSTVGYWVKRHGLVANGASKYAPRGGIDWEVLEILVHDGFTLKEMAEELDRSVATIQYWMRRTGLKTTGSARSRQVREAKRLGLGKIVRDCSRHGWTVFVLEGRGTYRCKLCRSQNVANWRRRKKALLAHEAGGRCFLCGYDRYMGALHFHHIDPSSKSFALSERGFTRSIEALRAEAAKCVLLCANCHAAVEAGELEMTP
jgi:Putative ATPase subunit of terminase (gpP-like)